MAENTNFNETVIAALEEKAIWYDKDGLPALLQNYRLLHTCVRNFFDFLVKKALIKPDPYRLDKKISDIVVPSTDPFNESDRSTVMGMRFSDYDVMLDFICNYYKFSTRSLTLASIKKLADFNNCIQWSSFSVNSNRTNTRVLATLILTARQNTDQMTSSMISDSISKAGQAMNAINSTLKEFAEYQKENFKGQIRKNVFDYPQFDKAAAASSPEAELAQIKKNFTAAMGKGPFYSDLVNEIVQEDHAPNKEELQAKILAKLQVKDKNAEKQKPKVDTKEMLMVAIRVLGAMAPQIEQTIKKLQANHDVLESEHNSFMDKLKKALRKAFNLAEKPLYYTILVSDAGGAKHQEKINYVQFVGDMATRSRRYAATANKGSPGYERVFAQKEDKILEYVNSQITDGQKMLKLLDGLDEFFKTAASLQNRGRIKGLKMEITALKNSVVQCNQHRAEYVAHMEEEAQFKKLGITNA